MKEHRSYEVVIIGGGIAGIAAALWCKRLGLEGLLIEKNENLGGQLHSVHNPIPDYPGFYGTGHQLVDVLTEQLKMLEFPYWLGTTVESLNLKNGFLESSKGSLRAKAIVLATGLRRRLLGCEGERGLAGKYLFYSASGQREHFIGKRVCIVGGGDGAFENALLLAGSSSSIDVVYRGKEPCARIDFREKVELSKKIHVYTNTDILECKENEGQVELLLSHLGKVRTFFCDVVLVKIGMQPVSNLIQGQIQTESGVFPCTNRSQRTTGQMLWAIGDVCSAVDPSLSVAVGQACLAMRDIQRLLRHLE